VTGCELFVEVLVCCDVAKAFQLLGAVWIGHLCGIRYRSMRVMRVSQFIDQTTEKLGYGER
jgi:hypothetical protein